MPRTSRRSREAILNSEIAVNVDFIRAAIAHPTSEVILENRRKENTRKQYSSAITRVTTAMKMIIEKLSANPANNVSLSLYDSIVGRDGFLLQEIPLDIYKLVLEHMSKKFLPNGEVTMMSQSAFTAVQSSIVYWYEISSDKRGRRILLSDEHKKHYTDYAKGRKRMIADFRTQGLLKSKEGKRYLTFGGYRMVARRALIEAPKPREVLLAHSFTVVSWNLMSRSKTLGRLLWNDIGWVGDCMTITYHTSKTNQEGVHVVPRHIFANPTDPLICPVLALGLKIIHETDFNSGRPSKIFYGPCGNERYINWLARLMRRLRPSEIAELGCPPTEIGTHSLRKGAATFVCGLVDGPHSDSVKLRMDHSIGSVDDRYIHIQAGTDKRVGRCVSGLDINNDDFCYLPPLFTNFDGVRFEKVLPYGRLQNASPSLKAAIPFMIASVIYHSDWLEKNLPKNHPYFTSKIYTEGFINTWKDKVSLSKRFCPITRLQMSGVPKYAQISQHVAELHETVLQQHDINQTRFDEIPTKVTEALLPRLTSINGIAVYNDETVVNVIERRYPHFETLLTDLRTFMHNFSGQEALRSTVDQSGEDFRQFHWGGGVHNIPEDYKMPQCPSLDIWRLWIFGCRPQGLHPFSELKSMPFSDKSQRTQFSKAKFVVNFVQAHLGMSTEQIRGLGVNQAETAFKEAYADILGHFDGYERMSYSTAYNYLKEIEKDINPGARQKAPRLTQQP